MSAFVAPIFPMSSPMSIDSSTIEAVDRAAQALFQNGLCATAEALYERLAEQPGADPMYRHRAALAREAHRADAAARMAMQSGLVPLPSAQRTASGAPRFVAMLPEDALLDSATEQRFTAELAGDGVDAELRHFLDETMSGDSAFVDLDAGEGLAACSALTAPAPAVQVVARVMNAAMAEALHASAALLSAAGRLSIVASDAELIAAISATSARWVHVRAGDAGDVPAAMAALMGAIHAGRIASIVWRLPAAGEALGPAEATAGTVLSVLGFQHFVVGIGAHGVELEPFDATPRGHSIIVSLAPAFIAEHAEQP
jgi:hypothetical protein